MWIKLCNWQFKLYVITKTGRSPRIVRRGSKRYQGNRDTIDKLFPSIPGGNNPSPSQKLITDPQTGKHRCFTVVLFLFFCLFWSLSCHVFNSESVIFIQHPSWGGGGLALSLHELHLLSIGRNIDFKEYGYWKCCWSSDG